jgi:ATP-dependent Lhr-like helicase
VASDLAALDPEAIATVRRDAAPGARDADELHDLLCLAGALPEDDAPVEAARLLDRLIAARRATRLVPPEGGPVLWVAAERIPLALAAFGGGTLAPVIAAAPGSPEPAHEDAVAAVVRGRLESCGPVTEAQLGAALGLGDLEVAIACAKLEGDGLILRGRFTSGETQQWCDRRLLARIHRLTIGRLRREIEPVAPADLARFLLRWQHLSPGSQLHGEQGLLRVLTQLQGVEAAVGAWEQKVLPSRVAQYLPALLDELAAAGEIVWGRRSDASATVTTRATPIALWLRAATPWMLAHRGPEPAPTNDDAPTAAVAAALRSRGALFYAELKDATGLMTGQLDQALWALVAGGRVTADGFGALRTLAAESPRRTGRWSLLAPTSTMAPADVAEQHARQLLHRYGVVHRELVRKEILPPWRDLLLVYRRLEARGELRGGRFVAGVVGEQFALPEAVETLRIVRREDAVDALGPVQRDPILARTGILGDQREDAPGTATATTST